MRVAQLSNVSFALKPLRQLIDRGNGWNGSDPAVPDNQRYYVIGDVHGRADLLRQLHAQIAEDARSAAPDMQCKVVYLGDYVDRGADSRGVIETLLNDNPSGFQKICLKGNHEDAMLRFLDDETRGAGWLAIGGQATLISYGVRVPKDLSPHEELQHIWLELRLRMPLEHMEFLSNLNVKHEAGDYLFVHAGIKPGRPLKEQRSKDMMWIRGEFLRSRLDHGKMVVHGHAPMERPDIQNNRIGIDTTAYATNILTCLVLEGRERRFIATEG